MLQRVKPAECGGFRTDCHAGIFSIAIFFKELQDFATGKLSTGQGQDGPGR